MSRKQPETVVPFPDDNVVAVGSRYKALGRVLDRTALPGLPKPLPLIQSWVDTRSAVVMIGATGSNKTFALIGWACSVASGSPWLGHEVAIEPSPVIYVVGEGASGFHARIAAWEADTETSIPAGRITLVLQPESLTDPEFWADLGRLADDLGARLVILDTFSSLAPDADEMKDAAAVIRRMSVLAVNIDGAVVLAHHTGWGPQDRARGGSQLEANPDSVIVMQKLDPEDPNSIVSILRKKDKDGPSGRRIHVARVQSDDSCVLEVVEAPVDSPKKKGDRAVQEAIRSVLVDTDEFTLTVDQVLKQVGGNAPTARRVLGAMIAEGLVLQEHRPRVERNGTRRRDLLAYNERHKAFRVDASTPTEGRSASDREDGPRSGLPNPDPADGRGSRGSRRRTR